MLQISLYANWVTIKTAMFSKSCIDEMNEIINRCNVIITHIPDGIKAMGTELELFNLIYLLSCRYNLYIE